MTSTLLNSTRACPHLGVHDDPTTRFMYPTEGNYCHKVSPLQEINPGYQEQVCLREGEFSDCPIYQNDEWKGKLPKSIRGNGHGNGRYRKTSARKNSSGFLTLVLGLVIGLIGLYAFLQLNGMKSSLADLQSEIATLESQNFDNEGDALASLDLTTTATLDPMSVLMPSVTPITPTLTLTASVTPNSSSTPIVIYLEHTLTNHFGLDSMFVVHKIISGENLALIARTYNTTAEMIIDLNCLDGPIQPDFVLLIAPDMEGSTNLPSFKVIQVEPATTVAELAIDSVTTETDLRLYNGWLEDIAVIPDGTWVIIPSACVANLNSIRTPTSIPIATATKEK